MPLSKKEKEVSEIKDAKVYEVSIVGEGANQRDFLMLKNKSGGGKMTDIIKSVLACELENEKEVDSILKEIDINDEGVYALKNMMKIIQTYADVLPKNLLTRLVELLTKAGDYEEKELMEGMEENMTKEKLDVKVFLKQADIGEELEDLTDEEVDLMYGQIRGLWSRTGMEFLEDIGASIVASMVARDINVDFDDPFVVATDFADGGNEDNPEHYDDDDDDDERGENIMQNINKEINKLPDSVKPLIEKLYKENQETSKKAIKLEKELQKEIDEKIEKQFIEKAKNEFSSLPVKSDDFGKLLKSINEKAPEEFEKLEKLMKTLNGAIGEGTVFREIGSNSDGGAVGAWGKIEKAAEQIRKDNPSISQAQAVSQIITANPELYSTYLKEQG